MPSKYYAVKKGKKPGIYHSWDDCKAQVHGFPGAIYKSFKTKEEADAFLGLGRVQAFNEEDCMVAYVDGSFYQGDEFSYGMVILWKGEEKHFCKKIVDKELASMRNVAGEIKGSEAAMRYAIEQGVKDLAIYHDYEGISKWCTGEWKANKVGTQNYRDYYQSIQSKLNVKFVKVKGHSNDKYNDLADKLAKKALDLI
ncbi:Ribonuclease HI-related protein [Lachnospiraceae bacterium TWA4]|nr:Ribonuclease HI-related protein [Lachnospiraceae bacterium TWA4]